MNVELALVGGGLANSLIAHRILCHDREYPLVVVERQHTLGANHTWSFHDSDLTIDQRRWLKSLVTHSWPRHELRFPNRQRTIESGYNSVSSERLHDVVSPLLGDRCLFGADVIDLSPNRIRLGDGSCIDARVVIDGRGNSGGHHFDVGYQKFVGLFLRLEEPHGLSGPILMDATVEQRDGYRFVYTLPLAENELLVEDTYYSDTPDLDTVGIGDRILDYVDRQGWVVAQRVGEEAGVLPIVLGGDIGAFWQQDSSPIPRSGMRAALFHPTTGYSLPEAVRLADEIARHRELESAELFEMTKKRSLDLWRRHAFFRLLNRMLFRAAEPEERYRIFERFYGLREDLIQRFYGGDLNWTDKLRLLTGKPPVPIHRAIPCFFERSFSASTANVESEGVS